MNKYIVICGPTASGKTQYAHDIAKKYNGEIVNADAAQIYKNLLIITASPAESLKSEIPYHLYNYITIDKIYSVIKYVKQASKIIFDIHNRGKLPIVVGGSGMYINALLYGYNEIPDIAEGVRDSVTLMHNKLGSQAFFQKLSSIDPISSKRLHPNDTQRVIRAYCVIHQTGKSIFDFYSGEKTNLLKNFIPKITLLLPQRELLYKMCNERFKNMIKNHAIDEVQNLLNKYNYDILYKTKIIGMKEILDFIQNKIALDDMISIASTNTRRYAKRQNTWFKNQIIPHKILSINVDH